ncbi:MULTISPECIES: helix-turn-helix domain-containing protein [unclassified Enterococcus]|uniref:helix-turn-helix domain-containing protein n=1 Tax=unclassified Enterococcus TaxID=2608891 RepID=UPI0013EB65B0|nr:MULTISPECIES: helix-turn-helix domain-containing protein [unclassified Enterococcus]
MNFYTFLERPVQLQLTILEQLHTTKKSRSLEQLSQLLKCDKRAALNHCEHIRELSVNNQFRKETRNYHFLGTNTDYQQLVLSILDHSTIFHLIRELCLYSSVDLAAFSVEKNISESFLRRHITHINKLLEKYQLQIKTGKGQIYIKGSEMQIRYLIYLVLWQAYHGVEWPFPSIDFHELFSEITSAFKIVNQKPNKIKMIEWCFIVAVTILRSNQGNVIPKESLPYFTDALWEGFETIASKLKQNYQRLQLSLTDTEFLFLWMQSRAAFYLKENYLDTAMKLHIKHATPVKQLHSSFFSYIYSIGFKSSKINPKKPLLNGTLLANGMHGYLFPQFSIIKHDITTFIETNYPAFYLEINRLSEKFKMDSPVLNWLHPWNLAEAFMIITSPASFNQEIKIKFETDFPIGLELAYMEMLQEQLRMYLNVVFTNDLLFKPELIIRTTDTPIKSVTYEEQIPCLTISTEMSSEQIYLLSQKIQELILTETKIAR